MAYEIEVTSDLQVGGRPAQFMNTTTLDTGDLASHPRVREIARELGRWVDNARGTNTAANMFRRDRFNPPNTPYALMRAAKDAVASDDVVASVLEATTAVGFRGVKWEGKNPDEADVFNQLNAELDLDFFIRSAYRDDFTYDQFVCAKVWDWQEFTVRGETTKGNKRKKTFRIWAPKRLVLLDSQMVVPIGRGALRADSLAWHAGENEVDAYTRSATGQDLGDPLMTAFFEGTYIPDRLEARQLADWGIDPANLLKMRPEWVFRHTAPKADWELFPTPKIKSVFSLLDLKQQMVASDRASLIGAANYILLIKQGTDQVPGTAAEIQHLKENYNFLAKMPVIIADHRLSLEIIAPKLDFVLKPDSYDLLDSRILSRLLGNLTLSKTGRASGGNDPTGALVARFMENRRHAIKRTFEREIAKAVVNHPKNAGKFDSPAPSLVYTPRNVSLDADQAYLSALLALRTQRELSRETTLEYLGLDEATEAQRMELEDELYDDIFKSIVPFASPEAQPNQGTGAKPASGKPAGNGGAKEAPAVSGSRGGRPAGGGSSPQSPAATAKPKTKNGNPSTAKAAETDEP